MTTFAFLYAGYQAQRTHGCSFDSIILYIAAIYNMIYIFEDLIKCSDPGQITQITFYTGGILYLFYNFEIMLKSMDKDLDSIRKQSNRNN